MQPGAGCRGELGVAEEEKEEEEEGEVGLHLDARPASGGLGCCV